MSDTEKLQKKRPGAPEKSIPLTYDEYKDLINLGFKKAAICKKYNITMYQLKKLSIEKAI